MGIKVKTDFIVAGQPPVDADIGMCNLCLCLLFLFLLLLS